LSNNKQNNSCLHLWPS